MTEVAKTNVDHAYAHIRKMIFDRELKPAERLSQRKLALKMGFSVFPVAEAMRRLQSDGLVIKEPLKMARVREISDKDVEGLYLVREAMEALAAYLCAKCISDEEIAQLQNLGRQFKQAVQIGDQDRFDRIEIEIHRFIVRCSDCLLLQEELGRLLLIERTTVAFNVRPDNLQSYQHSHQALIQTITDRDADSAEYAMRKHVRQGYQDVLGIREKNQRERKNSKARGYSCK